MADPTLQWQQFGTAVAAIGSLGVAAFGVVESFGKALAWSRFTRNGRHKHFGLPYVGLGTVMDMLKPFDPALQYAYGVEYQEIIAQKYFAGRSAGGAPDTIRQGIRLGLPFLPVAAAAGVIDEVWEIGAQYSLALATALQAEPPDPSAPPLPKSAVDPQSLAGRFSAALDARIDAAFEIAEERYENFAKTLAAALAIAMALGFNHALGSEHGGGYPWYIAMGIGLIAVPLAPVAKDLSTSLQNALTAFKSISGKT